MLDTFIQAINVDRPADPALQDGPVCVHCVICAVHDRAWVCAGGGSGREGKSHKQFIPAPKQAGVNEGCMFLPLCSVSCNDAAVRGFLCFGRSAMLFGQADVFESLQLLAYDLQSSRQRLSVKHATMGETDIHDLWAA